MLVVSNEDIFVLQSVNSTAFPVKSSAPQFLAQFLRLLNEFLPDAMHRTHFPRCV
jgi:hypothetical protein